MRGSSSEPYDEILSTRHTGGAANQPSELPFELRTFPPKAHSSTTHVEFQPLTAETMSYARARALRSLQSTLRSSRSARAIPRVSGTRVAVGRRYASGEGGGAHGHSEPSSDIPWAAGAIAVTIPSCWYLWPTSHADSGHHDAHGEHEHEEEGEGGEDHSGGDSIVPKAVAEALPEGVEKAVPDAVHNTSGESGDGEEGGNGGEDHSGGDSVVPKSVAEALPEGVEKAVPDAVHNTSGGDSGEEEDSADDKGDDSKEDSHAAKGDAAARNSTEQKQTAKATDKASGSQGEGQDTGSVTPSEVAEPKDGGSDSGVGKGKMSSDSAGAGGETRKREPDSKGGFKKRIDSGLQKDIGGTDQQVDEDGSDKYDQAAQSKAPLKGDAGQISSKQFGLSNTPTRHSTQIDQDQEKSKKAEGVDTAKAMGTIDPQRPAT
ncbi:hypothetical protein LTR29_005171 [Friedmanniomyces endolithicus]|nr:hypothetical protein LTR29_005171 [Friedmanniomyces endolithicus]